MKLKHLLVAIAVMAAPLADVGGAGCAIATSKCFSFMLRLVLGLLECPQSYAEIPYAQMICVFN